jgi:hypothetical protein
VNHQIPSVDQFLSSSEPDEDDTPDTTEWLPGHGPLRLTPMERVAEAVERLVELHTPMKTVTYDDISITQPLTAWEDESTRLIESGAEEALRLNNEALADLEAKHQTVLQVISDVEAALGKSKAAPALAARAVIEAWRNPVIEVQGQSDELTDTGLDHALETYPPGGPLDEPDLPSLADMDEVNESAPGHTRTPHPEGPDFCRECSGELQEWIVWPCPTVGGEQADAKPQGVHQQPEHNAPVEEWREYARALGYAGPEIDKANRSMIRTTLGIAQVPSPESTEGGS